MRIPLDRLIDGTILALTEHVAPQVPDRFARGQLWSVIDILNNLRERIDWKAGPLEDEAQSASNALGAVAECLRTHGHPAVAEAIPTIPTDGTATDRVIVARAALVRTIELLAPLPAEVATAAQAPLHAHLAMNALRDLQSFKPSLLHEISKG